MAKLDKTKPYGEVFGHSVWKFEQDNRHFDHNGIECTEDGKLVDKSDAKQGKGAEAGGSGEGTAPASGPVEPRMEHKGGGYYKVFNEKGEMVADSLSKAAAEAEVERINQMLKALQDG